MAFNLSTAKVSSMKGFDIGSMKLIGGDNSPGLTNTNPPEQPQTVIQAVKSVFQPPAPLPIRSPIEKEWWTENIPQSIANIPQNIVAGTAGMAYNAAKEFTDPVYNALSGNQLLDEAGMDLLNAPTNALNDVVKGVAAFSLNPFGIDEKTGKFSLDTMKKAWSDPSMALMGTLPITKGGVKGAARVAESAVKSPVKTIKNAPISLTKKSLKFSPSIKPELQTQVAETILREGAATTTKSYHEFAGKIKHKAKEVWDLIEPVAEVESPTNLGSVKAEALDWAATSTEKGKNVKKISKYLDQFEKDHPTLTVAEKQKIKVNLNKDLKTYYKSIAIDGKAKGNAVIQAKDFLMKKLRRDIDLAAPGTGKLNKSIHDITVAEPFLRVAMNKAEGRPLISTPEYHAGFLGASLGSAIGGFKGAGIGSPVAMTTSRILTDSKLQGKIARAIDSVNRKIKDTFTREEAASIVAEIKPKLTELSGMQGKSNYLAGLEEPTFQRNNLILNDWPVPDRAVRDSYIELFELARTDEGAALLKERLGREQKWTALLDELLAVPTQLTLPAGQGFQLIPDAQVKTFSTLGGKQIPTPGRNGLIGGGLGRAGRQHINAMNRGLTPENR